MNIKIAHRIKELRGDRTQPVFAQDLGISLQGYLNYEYGKRLPPADVLLKLSQISGRSVDWILTGREHERWTLSPGSILQIIPWVNEIYSTTKVEKVLMVSYIERLGTEKGFLFVTNDGIYSMAGTATRTDSMHGGLNNYCAILELIDFYGSLFYKIEFNETEIADWAKMDFKALLSDRKIKDKIDKTDIYDELRLFKPHLYPERKEHPIAGWSYRPLNTDFSRDWMQNTLDRGDVNKILIISYVNDAGIRTNGFVVDVGSESASMSGGEGPLAKWGSNYDERTNYGNLLATIEKKGIPLFKLELKEGDFLDLLKTKAPSLFSRPDVIKVDIDKELRAMNYPEHLREAMMMLNSESDEFIQQVVKLLRNRRADVDKLPKKKADK